MVCVVVRSWTRAAANLASLLGAGAAGGGGAEPATDDAITAVWVLISTRHRTFTFSLSQITLCEVKILEEEGNEATNSILYGARGREPTPAGLAVKRAV